MKCRFRLQVLVLLLGTGLVLIQAAPHTTALQTTASCAIVPEVPGPADLALAGSTGELSLDQKHAAFNEVLTSAVRYGDYAYPMAVTRTQQTFLSPVLLKSLAGMWRLKAAPGAVMDLRQRITLEAGSYLLKVRVDVVAEDAESVLSIRTRPAAPGPHAWSLVANIVAEESGLQDHEYRLQLDGPTTILLLAMFGPDDGQSAFILRSVELFR